MSVYRTVGPTLVILVISRFVFKTGVWLIAAVPALCILFTTLHGHVIMMRYIYHDISLLLSYCFFVIHSD